jgi:4-carboxymuconolactone decarboxylase
MSTPLNEKGLQIRKEMFGAEFVEKRHAEATDFTRPFVEMVNNFAFGEVWSRPGLERKTRSMLTLAMLVALNRPHELRIHVKGAVANGVTKDEVREIILQGLLYCGFPAAFEAFRTCADTLKEMGLE